MRSAAHDDRRRLTPTDRTVPAACLRVPAGPTAQDRAGRARGPAELDDEAGLMSRGDARAPLTVTSVLGATDDADDAGVELADDDRDRADRLHDARACRDRPRGTSAGSFALCPGLLRLRGCALVGSPCGRYADEYRREERRERHWRRAIPLTLVMCDILPRRG